MNASKIFDISKMNVDISALKDFDIKTLKSTQEIIIDELMNNILKKAELKKDDYMFFSPPETEYSCGFKSDKKTMSGHKITPEDVKKIIEKLKPEKYVFNVERRNYIFDISKAISCFSVIWINPNALKEIDIEPKEGIEGHKFYYGTRIIEVDDMPEYMLIGFDSGKREMYHINLLNKNYLRINSIKY